MSDTEVYTDKKYAPPRAIVQENIDRVMSGKIKIQSGAGADDYYESIDPDERPERIPPPPSLCIMECTAYALGWSTISDAPPCTSQFIMACLIDANDSIRSNQKRAGLKVLIEVIVNTAPYKYVTKNEKVRGKIVKIEKAETLEKDPVYVNLEEQREQRFDAWLRALPPRFRVMGRRNPNLFSADRKLSHGDVEWDNLTIPMFVEIITELANMGHFAQHNFDRDMETKIIESGENVGLPGESSSTTLPFGGDGQDNPTEERAPLQEDFPDSLPNTPPEGQASHEIPKDPDVQMTHFDQSDTADAKEDQKREEDK